MNLKLVANKAGVSEATASRVFNQPDLVDPRKVDAVKAAASELRYEPKKGSSAQRKRRQEKPLKRIGVWIIGASSSRAAQNLQEQLYLLQKCLESEGAEALVVFSKDQSEVPSLLSNGNLDGLLLQGYAPDESISKHIEGLPCVWLMTRREFNCKFDSVEPDNEANGRIAAQWFAQKGLKRVAVVNAWPRHPAFSARTQFFSNEAQIRSLELSKLEAGDWGKESFLEESPGDESVRKLVELYLAMQNVENIQGIYFPDDIIYSSFIRHLRNANIDVERLSCILGDHHPDLIEHLDPRPACLDINLPSIIKQAISRLSTLGQEPSSNVERLRILVPPILNH
ncbi:LacI family DNA-binding transcriptional regulator [Rubellicoccus peritrichatus]|uniref:LacI family DNA-binding transcriptional regulator n=1 Tax=Rubellicoccus peritrichatus TaxID=3080537 RepID=A0AAQ3L7X3_9BACT|nr:LacI family DNA-binding transcriptional regulator [Puniceicoccus sp. CR14]WOO40317.1 LacI family DNA-binding transcriptional regulator [Puniceicoccus sp. CR14]